ncbi:WD repeat-containing protein WRAP73 isoform X3 [Erinaceus europaeus]|uniref:WD repeat-containing protein WRAP73 isoform X3 n=1 Tax=Erinaceus europaeus TaxID=9365 RepID=A0ABM3Y895_ERIEU|nr:WD repeat-containing protein WRAP73 isoform X3 [Erinaceus europaeus]
MNFSEVFKLSGLLCKFSPNGKYLASCVQYRLVVRDVHTLQIVQLYTCLDQIQHAEWSADSLFILCAMYKRGLVQLRITVWSLCTKSVSYIKYPKACQQGISFTRDGRYMALAERRDCRDHVSVFVCSDWQLLRHFDTDTQDLAGLEWAPNGCVLAVWDSCLEYKILLYSLDGRLLSTYCAYEWSLGIKSVDWSPSSQFLAIGSYDGKVRILNHVTWKMITEFGHLATINNPKIVVYKEAEKSSRLALGYNSFPQLRAIGTLPSAESKYEIASMPVSLQILKPVADRANPKIGVGTMAFSSDNYFLATKNDNVPNAVWIWDVQKMRLFVVLEQLSPVRSFQWDPQQPRLAICTGSSKVYLWSPAGCVSVQVPGEGEQQGFSTRAQGRRRVILTVHPQHLWASRLFPVHVTSPPPIVAGMGEEVAPSDGRQRWGCASPLAHPCTQVIWGYIHLVTLTFNLMTTCLSPGDFQVLSLCWHLNGDSIALLSKDHFCLCFLETEGVRTTFGQLGDHT